MFFGSEKRKKPWQKRKKNLFLLKRQKPGAGKTIKRAIVFTAVFSVVYYVFFTSAFLISGISIKGSANVDRVRAENMIRNEIFSPILGFVPGNNFFFNRESKIESLLKKEFSEIESVEVTKTFPNSLEIKISEKDPALLWCRLGDCYFLDGEGVAFLKAASGWQKNNNGKKMIKVIEQAEIEEEVENESAEKKMARDEKENIKTEDKTEDKYSVEDKSALLPIGPGDKVSDRDFINFIFEADRAMKKIPLEIKYYKTKGTKTRELIAFSDKNVRIYFDATESAAVQAGYLDDFLRKGIEKEKINTLEYIYLKAGNKIFYK